MVRQDTEHGEWLSERRAARLTRSTVQGFRTVADFGGIRCRRGRRRFLWRTRFYDLAEVCLYASALATYRATGSWPDYSDAISDHRDLADQASLAQVS